MRQLNDPALVEDQELKAEMYLRQATAEISAGRYEEALRILNEDVTRALEGGGETSLLAEALTAQGLALARTGQPQSSRETLWRAAAAAELAGVPECGARSLLVLIEEHASWLPDTELFEAYERADELLAHTRDASAVARLRACVRLVLDARLASAPALLGPPGGAGRGKFSLYEALRAFEARRIERALAEAHGSVTRASRLLGFKHHGSLSSLLRGRHKNLAHLRTRPEPRKRGGPRRKAKAKRAVAILHAEDNRLVAEAVSETLESLGWGVETCADGAEAARRLEAGATFDVLIFDNDLPELSGLELVRRARRLPHLRDTPVIMFSAGDIEAEARAAGADAFLKKPGGVISLSATVTRLLDERAGKI